jgi:3-hydroxyacyl-CoA dehydrogenase/enoyl-CoA hydratase/3-hydroxybutyryl-CoA epimerase
MIGAVLALPLILEGKALDPKSALAMGLVNEVVPAAELIGAAKSWIKEKGDAKAPWDKDGYKIPGGGPYSDEANQQFIAGNALIVKQTYGNYEAQKAIMSCVYEGLQVPIDVGLRVECRYITKLMLAPQSRNMMRTLFLSMQELGKLARRPKGVPASQVKKLGVLGAGMMGAGIAYVSALAGMEVVLLDATQEAAEKGKAHAKDILDKAVAKGRQTAEKRDQILARITATTSYDLLKGADLVIEAVFEDRKIKADVTKKAEAQLASAAVFGSNTSTLPITGLAEASARPENFIGIHFFSPVDRMPLVELILGKTTSPAALAKAMDYVQAIKKTPIVVNDRRGFYTSRCFSTYADEGMQMLLEGYKPALIENIGRQTGMPRGPLEISDDVALDLAFKISEATRKETGHPARPVDELLRKMVVDLGRLGRKNGKGFYDYPADGKKLLWPGLKDLAAPKILEAAPPLIAELKTRLLYRQALEAARCVEESVVTDPRDGDVGAILGWGFAPYTGGPLSLIDTVGAKAFVATCDHFAKRLGERWMPCTLLREMAEKGETFYGRFGEKKAA